MTTRPTSLRNIQLCKKDLLARFFNNQITDEAFHVHMKELDRLHEELLNQVQPVAKKQQPSVA